MARPLGIAIVVENDDGSTSAAFLQTPQVPNNAGLFLYRYLRETRRKDAPAFFGFGVMDEPEAEAIERVAERMGI